MNSSAILKKVYKKAIDNGYKSIYGDLESALNCKSLVFHDCARSFYGILPNNSHTVWFSYADLILDHAFAKSFWGEDYFIFHSDNGLDLVKWQYYLQIMVLEKEPLKYLEKFL